MCCFGHGFRSSLLGMIRRSNGLNSPQSLWYQGTTVLRAKKHLYTCASVQTRAHMPHMYTQIRTGAAAWCESGSH